MLKHHSVYDSRAIRAFCASRNDLPTLVQSVDDVGYCIDAPQIACGSHRRVDEYVTEYGDARPAFTIADCMFPRP